MTVRKSDIHIGIITALEKEFAAMKVLLQNGDYYFPRNQDSNERYYIGCIESIRGGTHQVALALAGMGNNFASIRAANLLNEFPRVNHLIMTGIAGGIPSPEKPTDHVRLGDIVISAEGGVVQYDFVKNAAKKIKHRHPPRPPSATLLKSVQHIKTLEYEGQQPWLKYIGEATKRLSESLEKPDRPPDREDILFDTVSPKKIVAHPADELRKKGIPRIHYGTIASSDTLLKNPILRDKLREQFDVKAVEMEASGVADASWNSDKAGYLVVRGICDYCDSHKNDRWQMYAAVVAAAYTLTVIESLPMRWKHKTPSKSYSKKNTFYEVLEKELEMNSSFYFDHLNSQPEKGSNYTLYYFREQPGWLSHKFNSIKSKINNGKLKLEIADEMIDGLDEITEQLDHIQRLLELGLEVKPDHPAALTVLEALQFARVNLSSVCNDVWETRGNRIDNNLVDSMSALGLQIDFLRQLMNEFKNQTPVLLIT